MRSPVSFRDGHVEGATNLPLKNFTNMLMATKDKNKSFILYGVTDSDPDIVHGINYAEQLGFSKIFVSDYTTLR
jgi:3-mercaptopyruvate sulfurtransferase SseA